MTIDYIIEECKSGRIPIEKAQLLMRQCAASPLKYATVDYQRRKRCGENEIIYGLSKSSCQIIGIMNEMTLNGINRILVTRLDETKVQDILPFFPDARYEPIPQLLIYDKETNADVFGQIAVVTAGTSDLAVAEEAACVSEYLHHNVSRFYDVGVAGLHRLLNRIDEIRSSDIVITVAGMEGALASVVGGLVDRPVIAVPTSIGYGASFNGLSALLSMLNSCSSGVGVMNIDNGFGAAMLANNILRLCREKNNGML